MRTKLHNSRLAQRYRRTKERITNRAVDEISKRIIPSSTPKPPKPEQSLSEKISLWDGRPARRSTERRSFIPDPSIPPPRGICESRAHYGLVPPSRASLPPQLPSSLVSGFFPCPPLLSPAVSPPPVVAPPPPVAPPPSPPLRRVSPTTKRITAWISDLPPSSTPPPPSPPLRHRSSRSSRHPRAGHHCSTATEVILSQNNSTAGTTTATLLPPSRLARVTDAALLALSRPALYLQSSYHRFLFPIIWLVFDLLRATLQFFSSDAANLLPLVCLLFIVFGTFLAIDYFIWMVVFWVWFFSQSVMWGSLLGFGAAVYFCGIGSTLEFLLPWVEWGLMINDYMNETSDPVPAPAAEGRKPSYRAWWEAEQGIRNCSLRS
ncbi:MAG: hypothetical protein OHK93_007033 [Ramalina farinacea]|uniref:Uncharacterized protein n=1 Tax=Ramalina farinacea TaxID=258253 RepID=A0AA43QJP2_9LECA|nr:hypothetical protein [Ramalina farinacea]